MPRRCGDFGNGGLWMAIRSQVTCPHCWFAFAPYDALWISEHADLLGDVRLGPDHARRFLPDRFTPAGAALDARGQACHRLACPSCHLELPRAVFELAPLVLSTLGAPACGKSYFLAAMTWTLRGLLPKQFALGFADADNLLNARIQQYESAQFLNPQCDELVELPKTETHGDLYSTVLYDGQPVQYLRPFMFRLAPLAHHPRSGQAQALGRVLCLYDNAGESFLPGADTTANPVTRHLATSHALFFLVDPMQDARFRREVQVRRPQAAEPQHTLAPGRISPLRQETVLHEAAERARRYRRPASQGRPLPTTIVVVTKFDTWWPLLPYPQGRLPPAWTYSAAAGMAGVRLREVERVSAEVRRLLRALCPELVGAVETLCPEAVYIPTSATGGAAEVDPKTGQRGFRPKNVRPLWTETPLLYFLARWARGLVGYVAKPGTSERRT